MWLGANCKKKNYLLKTLNGGTLSSTKWWCDFVDSEQRTVLVKCTKVKAFICLALFHILSAIEIVDWSLIIIWLGKSGLSVRWECLRTITTCSITDLCHKTIFFLKYQSLFITMFIQILLPYFTDWRRGTKKLLMSKLLQEFESMWKIENLKVCTEVVNLLGFFFFFLLLAASYWDCVLVYVLP